jgi:hypothetical protein
MNNLKELFCLFDWATNGKLLGTQKRFISYYAKPIEAARDKTASDTTIRLSQKVGEELHALLQPHFLQRMKQDYLSHLLPTKTEVIVWVHLSEIQRRIYKDFVRSGSLVTSILNGEKTSPLVAITWLKKLCGHPLLTQRLGEGELSVRLLTMKREEVIDQSCKLAILVDLVQQLRAENHRTLIFSQSTRCLDIIQHVLVGIRFARIDGSTPEKGRQRFVDEFNSERCPYDVMLLSTKAAGVGLTLTGADRVIVFDPSWTPSEDAQAVDRCYRIGQTRPVVVYRFISSGTVEEKIYEKQIHKDGIRRAVFSAGGGESVQRYFDNSELGQLFKLGEPGKSEVMDKLQKEAQSTGVEFDLQQFTFVNSLDGTVGLTCHDGVYSTAAEPEESLLTASPFARIGKTQRILHDVGGAEIPLGRKLQGRSKSGDLSVGTDKSISTIPDSDDKSQASRATSQSIQRPHSVSLDLHAGRDSWVSDDEIPACTSDDGIPVWAPNGKIPAPGSTPKQPDRMSKGLFSPEVEEIAWNAETPFPRTPLGLVPSNTRNEANLYRSAKPETFGTENAAGFSGGMKGSASFFPADEMDPLPTLLAPKSDDVESDIGHSQSPSCMSAGLNEVLFRVDKLKMQGKHKRALKLLMDMQETSYQNFDGVEKSRLHEEIANLAGPLGLLN